MYDRRVAYQTTRRDARDIDTGARARSVKHYDYAGTSNYPKFYLLA